MCLIIDSCTIPSVFDANSKNHANFIPVLNWVTVGSGRMVYGGTKYKTELLNLRRYFKLIGELSKQGRVLEMPGPPIDEYAALLKIRVPDADFDDEHLVAIVAKSKCRIVCTVDKRAHPYLQRSDLYRKMVKPPKIYSAAIHVALCCDENVVGICRGRTKRAKARKNT